MKGKDIIVEKTHKIETRSLNKRTIIIRRTERQLILLKIIDALDQTLNSLRTERDRYTCDKEKWNNITENIRIIRKKIAGFGNEFWEIDRRINPKYHDPASWARDLINDKLNNKYVCQNDVKIINEIFNKKS